MLIRQMPFRLALIIQFFFWKQEHRWNADYDIPRGNTFIIWALQYFVVKFGRTSFISSKEIMPIQTGKKIEIFFFRILILFVKLIHFFKLTWGILFSLILRGAIGLVISYSKHPLQHNQRFSVFMDLSVWNPKFSH